MEIPQFALERFFALHEFSSKFLLSSSDCESLAQTELLSMADAATRKLWDDLRLGYTESSGHPLLRREIANLYQTVWPDDVLVLTPEEGIFVALNSLLTKGDHAIILSPAYQSLHEIAKSAGAQVSPWVLETDGVQWNLDLGFLERERRPNTKLLVINFPHNPTGFHIDGKTQTKILDFVHEHKIILFSDEMYRFAEYRPEDRLPTVADLYDRGVTLGGLSKAFGLPGLRIGWLATKDRQMLDGFKAFKDYTTICSSAPSEILAVIALRARDRIIDRTIRILLENLTHADQFFAKHDTRFEWIRPLASPVAFPRLKGTDSIERFCGKLREQKSTLLVPGSIFEFPGNHFRIGLGRIDLEEGLKQVDAFLRENY